LQIQIEMPDNKEVRMKAKRMLRQSFANKGLLIKISFAETLLPTKWQQPYKL
jgi:hypothetical protein